MSFMDITDEEGQPIIFIASLSDDLKITVGEIDDKGKQVAKEDNGELVGDIYSGNTYEVKNIPEKYRKLAMKTPVRSLCKVKGHFEEIAESKDSPPNSAFIDYIFVLTKESLEEVEKILKGFESKKE